MLDRNKHQERGLTAGRAPRDRHCNAEFDDQTLRTGAAPGDGQPLTANVIATNEVFTLNIVMGANIRLSGTDTATAGAALVEEI